MVGDIAKLRFVERNVVFGARGWRNDDRSLEVSKSSMGTSICSVASELIEYGKFTRYMCRSTEKEASIKTRGPQRRGEEREASREHQDNAT